jgi:putative CocE/NonD family hydrolase
VSRLTSVVAQRLMALPAPLDRAVGVAPDVGVSMDDGVVLLADLYTPAGPGPHPTVLVRSPYGRRGPLGLFLGRAFAERGYRVVLQSCRGTFGSGGDFEPHFHERADGLATVRWIEAQDWFDGRLAMNGPSYLGDVQWAIADAVGPSLRALCTHVTYSDITQHWYRGGSFSLEDAIEWSSMVSEQEHGRFRGIRDLLETRNRRIDRVIDHLPVGELDRQVLGRPLPFWHWFVDHASDDDPFWAPVNHSARLGHVSAPVLQVGGWYDIFLPVQLADHDRLVQAGQHPRLVIGPWTHTAAPGFRAQLTESLLWLDHHVRGVHPGDADAPPVRLFVMGAGRWRDFASWPPAGYPPQRWHLHRGGRLAPADPEPSDPDRYTYDPADPTPISGGTLLRRAGGRRGQGRTEARPDVLVFTSDVLGRDLEVIGAVGADIHVASDLEDFDVFVRLCDVDPKGRSRNVCDGITRVSPSRWPRPPDGVWAVHVELWPTAQRFAAGHRVRLQVSSGAHPRFIRNLGTGDPLATATAMRVAHQAIYHDPQHRSTVSLPIGSAS